MRSRGFFAALGLLVSLFASVATAQSIYIDFGHGAPSPPSSSYAAASGLPGHWNEVYRTVSGAQPLLDVHQQPTPATFHHGGCDSDDTDYASTTGDDDALLDDFFYYDCSHPPPPWTDEVRGLRAGTYQIFIYAATGADITLTLPTGGTVDGSNYIEWEGTAWPGSFVDYFFGVRVLHLPNENSTLLLSASGFGLSGMQLVRLADATPFCSGHLGGCPCGVGLPGAGCPSSFNPSGAPLSGTGSMQVSNDTLHVNASGVLPTGLCILFQGTTAPGNGQGVLYGDGLRCAGGTLKRIGQRAAVGGVFQYPNAGDPPISVRGLVPSSGGFRTYQVQYRSPASYCNPDTFNATNGLAVLWSP